MFSHLVESASRNSNKQTLTNDSILRYPTTLEKPSLTPQIIIYLAGVVVAIYIAQEYKEQVSQSLGLDLASFRFQMRN